MAARRRWLCPLCCLSMRARFDHAPPVEWPSLAELGDECREHSEEQVAAARATCAAVEPRRCEVRRLSLDVWFRRCRAGVAFSGTRRRSRGVCALVRVPSAVSPAALGAVR